MFSVPLVRSQSRGLGPFWGLAVPRHLRSGTFPMTHLAYVPARGANVVDVLSDPRVTLWARRLGRLAPRIAECLAERLSAGTTRSRWGAVLSRPRSGILWREGMAVLTLRLGRVLGNRRQTAKGIDSRRDRLQVRGIHTATIPAQMIQFEMGGDGADKDGVGGTVSAPNAQPAFVQVCADPAVSIKASSRPFPALVGTVGKQLESLSERHRGDSHTERYGY